MINKLSIKNFQSHKFSELDLHPGLNIIIGSTDSGKTSILRALRWLIWNKPGGGTFKSDWGGETEVIAEFDNCRVERIKGKDNEYKLGDSVFKAFGSNVPSHIAKMINMGEINLQRQLDGPFLLNKSPGDAAKHFNKIAHLSAIDIGLKNVQQEIRSIENQIKYQEQDLERYELEEMIQYDHVDKMEMHVEDLEAQLSDRMSKISILNKLRKILALHDGIEAALRKENKIARLSKYVRLLGKLQKKSTDKRKEKIQLFHLIASLEAITSTLAEEEKLQPLKPSVTKILNKINHKEKKEKILKQFRNIIRLYEASSLEMKELQKKSTTDLKLYKDNMPDICPLCDTKLTK